MNKYAIPKLVNLAIILAFALPLIYGLYLYDWDLETFLGLDKLEVVVDVSTEVSSIYDGEGYIVVQLMIKNIGNVEVNITRVEAVLEGVMDRQMPVRLQSELTYDRGEALKPGESITVDLMFNVDTPGAAGLYYSVFTYELQVFVYGDVYGREIIFPESFKGELTK